VAWQIGTKKETPNNNTLLCKMSQDEFLIGGLDLLFLVFFLSACAERNMVSGISNFELAHNVIVSTIEAKKKLTMMAS